MSNYAICGLSVVPVGSSFSLTCTLGIFYTRTFRNVHTVTAIWTNTGIGRNMTVKRNVHQSKRVEKFLISGCNELDALIKGKGPAVQLLKFESIVE